MSDDIVARLLRFRPVYDWPEETSTVVEKPLNQVAVDEITRLRDALAAVTAERDRMREALKPFAVSEGVIDRWYSSDDFFSYVPDGHPVLSNKITVGDLRRARAALEGVTEKGVRR